MPFSFVFSSTFLRLSDFVDWILQDLIGMLARLASGSLAAVRTLFELNMSSTLKDILASTDLSHGTPHSHVGNIDPNQVFNHAQQTCMLCLLEVSNPFDI